MRLFCEMQKYAEELKSFENELSNQQEQERDNQNKDGELEVVVLTDSDILLAAKATERQGSTFMDHQLQRSSLP